ncbi:MULTISPECIES: hypothetical protein [Klebsiella pneumoniae complex]|nr:MULTISPECIES: hypothetical protein [Klebsiella]MCB3511094.1 hypothetical protein [Klebsiella variicola]MCE0159151.1 hypothetical protein [Klebsiella variicola subsp. variicola]MDE4726900.1 hypothetical protein [Klebsiella pneumoniae]MDE4740524.1 hypothetical protein [Klebsiella pneumoniae]MDE4746107.1 hypothetical protein [Klebsiella pneumoniae]
MKDNRTVIKTLEDALEAVNALILFTLGSEHMSVIQGMYDISPALKMHQVNEIFLRELNNSIIPDTREIVSNLHPNGSHVGRDLVITLTRH